MQESMGHNVITMTLTASTKKTEMYTNQRLESRTMNQPSLRIIIMDKILKVVPEKHSLQSGAH